MKVLNLQCTVKHSFEGWFASEDDFRSQLARGLLECPMCADTGIQKLPSAPRLNLGGRTAEPATAEVPTPDESQIDTARPSTDSVPAIRPTRIPAAGGQAAFLKALRQLVASTEDVGPRFAEEARRMHYGDIEPRRIRGQTSAEQAIELLEEGIDVVPLPMQAALKETLQ